MSGGALTDYEHNLFHLDEWSDRIEGENPLLAELMRDLCKLLHVYDDYMSGDKGEESVTKAWEVFHTKWIGISKEDLAGHIAMKAMKQAEAYVESVRTGFDSRPKWWEVDE